MRPQFGLHQDAEFGLQAIQKTAHRAWIVIGQIGVPEIRDGQRRRPRRAARGCGCEIQRMGGEMCGEIFNQRGGGIDLADRHRMQPDTPDRRRRAAIAETRRPAAQITPIAQAAPQQMQRQQRQNAIGQQAIRGHSPVQSRGVRNSAANRASRLSGSGCQALFQAVSGGREPKMHSTRPPDCRPNRVPRSYSRLNSA